MPKRDMIGVHLLKIEVLFSYWADALLLFIGCAGILPVKLRQAQMFFFSCQQIFIYTAVLGELFVCHKSGYFYLQRCRIKHIALMFMIEPSPIRSMLVLRPVCSYFNILKSIWRDAWGLRWSTNQPTKAIPKSRITMRFSGFLNMEGALTLLPAFQQGSAVLLLFRNNLSINHIKRIIKMIQFCFFCT